MKIPVNFRLKTPSTYNDLTMDESFLEPVLQRLMNVVSGARFSHACDGREETIERVI